MPYNIPDGDAPTLDYTVEIALPDNPRWRAIFLGAVLYLAQPRNHRETSTSTLTPDEVAGVWQSVADDLIGDIYD